MNLLQIQIEERIDLIGFMSRFKVDRDLTLDLLDIEFFGAIYRGFFFLLFEPGKIDAQIGSKNRRISHQDIAKLACLTAFIEPF